MKGSLLFLVIVLCLVFACSATALAYTDTTDHWAKESIDRLSEEEILGGYEDGTYRPNNYVSRAEFIAMVNRVLEYRGGAEISFADVSADNWFYQDMGIAVQYGFINGYEDNTIRPNSYIARQDVAAILCRAVGLTEDTSAVADLADQAQIASYAQGAVGAVIKAGLFGGYEDNTIRPTRNTSRAEVAVILDKLIQYLDAQIEQTVPETPAYVHVITDQEIELGYSAPISARAANRLFSVTVDGKAAEFFFLSQFDGMVNLRLAEPLADPAAAVVAVTPAGGTAIQAEYVPFYTQTRTTTNVFFPVRGNENSGMNETYDYHYVLNYCMGGIYQMLGQTDYTGLAANENGMNVVVVGSDQTVYLAPEYRELYNPADAATRRTIAGTPENPTIVTTADDVMRLASTGEMQRTQSDRFYMMHDFAQLFWQIGVIPGCEQYPLSIYDDPDTYNYVKHLQEAYAAAKAKNLWPGTKMMESLENYFTYATMVWFETLPESADGSWQPEAFPVNTRAELIKYDVALYEVMVEIYTEFKYFSGTMDQCDTAVDSEIRAKQPWFKHSQVDNYDIQGKAYAPLQVVEVNLISANQVELIFNREVRDLDALRNNENWEVVWEKDGVQTVFRGGDEGATALVCQRYQWKTLTLKLGDRSTNLSTGSIGSSIMGFTAKDLENAPEWLAADSEVTVSATALEKGEYINVEKMVSERNAGIDGSLTVRVVANGDAMCDWAGNALGAFSSEVAFKPYLGQAYRSPKTGVYIYGDNDVQRSSLELAGAYVDIILSNQTDDIGQKIADGLVKTNAGVQIIAYGHHAYQQPAMRDTYGGLYMYYLYVEGFGGSICQTTESNLLRDIPFTRYKGEFIMGHEFAHSIESAMRVYLPELYDEIGAVYEARAYDRTDGSTRWPQATYAGSNRAEYFATLSNIWHGTMRESASGLWDGTLSPINTREELYRYDPRGYELMKKIYYNGEANLFYSDGTPLTVEATNDDVLKWGSTFSNSLSEQYPQAKWVLWAASNSYDFDPANPEGAGIALSADQVNYHPYYNGTGMPNPAQ